MTTSLTRRQELVILTLAEIRNDIKFYKLTGALPQYAGSIYELKELAAIYAEKLYNLRNGK